MLLPNEIAAGYPADATGLTFVLPRAKYENTFLITDATDPAMAVQIDTGEERFTSFESVDNRSLAGALVPSVGIELDEASLFDPEMEGLPLGALLRIDTRLCIATKPQGRFSRVLYRVTLIDDLPMSREGLLLGCRRWVIIIGHGETRRELYCVDLTANT